MRTTRRHPRLGFGLGSLVLGLTLAVTGFASVPAGAAANGNSASGGSVTLCHRTNAPSNPYRVVTVAFDASNGELQGPDHTGHAGPAFDFSADPADADYPYTTPRDGDQWGDIIPPYSWSGGSFPGRNWTEGQAIWESGCGVPATPAVGSVTLDKVTAGDDQPLDTTVFTFSVECEEAVVPEAAPDIAPADPPALAAADVAIGTTCTIGEGAVSDAGFASATFSVDGGPAVPGPVTVTMDQAEQVISVVATNTYQCVAPLVADGAGGCVPPVVVTDACPAIEGVQTDTTLCPPAVEGSAVTTTTTTTTAPAAVEGVQVRAGAELPRTGSGTSRLALFGLGLVLLGAGALLVGRDEHLVTS